MARRGGGTFDCPNCGAEVRRGARSCPECGADDETGWSGDTMYDGLDLPDPGYGEPAEATPARSRGNLYRLVAIVLLVMIALLFVTKIL